MRWRSSVSSDYDAPLSDCANFMLIAILATDVAHNYTVVTIKLFDRKTGITA